MFPLTRLAALASVGLLVGCGHSDNIFYGIVRREDDAFARAYFDSVRAARVDFALSVLSPRVALLPGVRDSVVVLSTHLPGGPIDSMHLIGANRFTTSSDERTNLVYEYHSAAGWGAVTMTVASELGIRYIDGIRANNLKRSFEDANAFTFRDKGAGHYVMLALLIVCIGASFSVAFLAVRTPMPRRWLWALLALVGVSNFVFNWSTGESGIQFLSVLLFGGAALRAGPAAPWILKAAFPIGALLTWRRIQRARNPTTAAATNPPPSLATPSAP
jgi:hypothetical protein